MSPEQATLDHKKVEEFLGKAISDVAATFHAGLVLIGDKLGLYRAMADAGALTPAELAMRTGARERYVREWLSAQAAGGYVTYDSASGRFTLPPEHAFLLLDADLPGAFQLSVGSIRDEPKITDAFRTGAGVGWHEHDAGVYEGCERFFRPGYAMNLVSQWIPALDGVKARIEAGGRVADVGCGHGASTIIMAQAFPHATIKGFDYHPASIEAARRAADKAGMGDRVSFEVTAAKAYPGTGYDLVTFFDSLHDMGDPVGAARHVRESLAPGGTWMLVEPLANDRLEDNFNPVGRLYYAASTLLCTPASLSQEVGLALGAQAGEKRLREVLTEAGFTRIRRVGQTPANMVLEVRA
ncbi:MAG TPA: methyltransferase domain-containing protein [Verrucomicrobiae bacterium]|jgi:SAM-dependent methyltransferase|nr:methyltransferase domain-containing protein [Verrucomicrobiae bacterium]